MKNFINNLLQNFELHSVRESVKLVNIKDELIMGKSIVPCLYIANLDWPADLREIFNPKDSSFKLGKYSRIANSSEIDAEFDVIDENGTKKIGVIDCKNRETPVSSSDYKEIIEKAIKYSKIKKLETFFDSLRPLVNVEGEFDEFVDSLMSPSAMEKSIKSDKFLIEKFEDPNKFEIVKNELKGLINNRNLDEFKSLLKDLDGFKTTTPLYHFLICKKCDDLNLEDFIKTDPKINVFRFVKNKENVHNIISVVSSAHADPDFVAFIMEVDVINETVNELNN